MGSVDTERLYTLQEACAFLRCSRTTLYRLIAEKKLRAFKIGASWRFRAEDMEAVLRAASAPASILRALEQQKTEEERNAKDTTRSRRRRKPPDTGVQ